MFLGAWSDQRDTPAVFDRGLTAKFNAYGACDAYELAV